MLNSVSGYRRTNIGFGRFTMDEATEKLTEAKTREKGIFVEDDNSQARYLVTLIDGNGADIIFWGHDASRASNYNLIRCPFNVKNGVCEHATIKGEGSPENLPYKSNEI